MKTSFKCRNCGFTGSKIKYSFKNTEKKIVQCKMCKLMVLHPFPTQDDLGKVYNEDYFMNKNLVMPDVSGIYGYLDYASERMNKQKSYRKVCKTLKKYQVSEEKKPRLLDFGCGLGYFMDSAYDFGYQVSGVEFNRHTIKLIRERYNYDMMDFEEFQKSSKEYDVITMFDVIEHLIDPFETLESIKDLLTDNGILAISTMDSRSWISRIMGRRLEDFRRISEHIYFFSKRNLVEILIKSGFEILEVRKPGHSFELEHLCGRLKNIVAPLSFILKLILIIFPFLKKVNIYVNPFTKVIIYARKKNVVVQKEFSGKLISIVMPVYNEMLFVEKTIEKVMNTDFGMKKELLVIDDGSTDQTSEILKGYGGREDVKVIRIEHGGKGAAVAKGISRSKGDYVVIQDADLEYNPENISKLLDVAVKTGASAVYGTRYSGAYRKTGFFLNTIANNFLTFLTNVITGLNLSDMETGYKLFSGPVIRSLEIRSRGFEFEAEVTCKVNRLKISIFETPISYNARSYIEGKKIRFSDGIKAIYALFKYGFGKST